MTDALAVLCETPEITSIDEAEAPTRPVPRDAEALRRARLFDWLRDNEAVFVPLAIDQCAGDRGVRSDLDVADGAEVAHIPSRLFITPDTARQSALGLKLAAWSTTASTQEISERAWLTLFLLETSRDGGFWAPYVDALPRSFPGHPLQYGPLELMALHPASALGGVVSAVRNLHQGDFASIAGFLALEGFNRDDFDWAYCCIRTRAYRIPTDDGEVLTLIPLADMLNHVNRPSTIGKRPTRDGYVITATRAIAAGDEVTATYGDFGNAQLLPVYGFCLDDNELDIAILPFGDGPLLVNRKYANATVRDMFQKLRRSIPIALAESMSTDGRSPCTINNEWVCLNTIYQTCEVALSRFENGLGDGEPAHAFVDRHEGLRMLLDAIESEKKVLWHFALIATTAGRVLCDRGANAQDKALLAYLDADYAADVMQLIEGKEVPHED